ncbi:MAG: monofunctional biosynthetic peptidoglycan transglycosylase [Elusimicrobia bacterium]|nr:monofunctional biosynthetic peptidoglycan transglycosylase [Elusimicrobiota bacterium]
MTTRSLRALTFGVLPATLVVTGCLVYLFWLPDVSYLARENPRTTAYIELYVRRTLAKKKKPLVMMKWARMDEISPHLKHAVIIAEDDMFYKHGGVDWDSVRQALKHDWEKKKFARGASTITQQVARNVFLSPSRNPLRKIKEILIAYKLEQYLSKDRILEVYLNIAEWGVGVYGVQAASEIYFGKDAKDINPQEAVSLAAALPSPWRLNPDAPPKKWLEKRKDVLLERMRKAGYLPPGLPESEVSFPEDPPLGAEDDDDVPVSTRTAPAPLEAPAVPGVPRATP